ncbi:MAG: helix-turn-helix domain-containing protein [Clostridia bacterium]|nr:helix-turn-helix domain-containing protein [Clostridia bacterium]
MTLGERIKEQRTKAKMSQEKLAELVGVSRQAVTKWEAGQSSPSTENLFRIAEVLGTTVDILTKEEPHQLLTEEQVYDIYKKVRARRTKELGRHILHFAAVLSLYYIFSIICKLIVLDLKDAAVTAILFSAEAGDSYLIGWLFHSNLWFYASYISAIPTLFGKWKYSLITFSGFALGIPLGELFGRNPDGAQWGFGHYGWAIWGGIFVLSIIMGVIFQKKKLDFRTKQGRIWLISFALLTIAIIFFVRVNMVTSEF